MKLLLLLVILPGIFGSEIIWKNGPTDLLREIFKITEIKNVEDLESVVSQTTSKWLRPRFMEKWHGYSLLDKHRKEELTKLIRASDLAKERPPLQKHYSAAIIMGYSKERVQKRINYLINLCEQGIVFDKIYLLGATRKFKISTEVGQSASPNFYKKGVSIEDLWDQASKSELFKKIPTEIIKIHKISTKFGATSEKLLKTVMERYNGETKGKKILIIADGRSAGSRASLAERALEPYEVELETVWQASSIDGESIEDILVGIAKCLLYLRR